MNQILRKTGRTDSGDELTIEWRPDIQRLEAAAKATLERGIADPWRLAEAECWLDLIEAELIAVKRERGGDRATQSWLTLQEWKQRVSATIQLLKGLPERRR